MIDMAKTLADALPEQLPPEPLQELAEIVYAELETRVGNRICEVIPETSTLAFEEAIDAGDEALAHQILEVECPQYKDIVAATLQELIVEVAERFSAPTGR